MNKRKSDDCCRYRSHPWHGIDIGDCPPIAIERLKHYFLTYKDLPGEKRKVTITEIYGREEAQEVIRRSMDDYRETFKEY